MYLCILQKKQLFFNVFKIENSYMYEKGRYTHTHAHTRLYWGDNVNGYTVTLHSCQ